MSAPYDERWDSTAVEAMESAESSTRGLSTNEMYMAGDAAKVCLTCDTKQLRRNMTRGADQHWRCSDKTACTKRWNAANGETDDFNDTGYRQHSYRDRIADEDAMSTRRGDE